MPNWCYTQITINGKASELIKFEKMLTEWTSEEKSHPNGFGPNWLGNVVLNSGIADNLEDYECRGEITYEEVFLDNNEEGQMVIDVSSAWGPMNELWKDIINRDIPDCEFIYESEEPGFRLYETNDPALVGLYMADTGVKDIPGLSEDMHPETLKSILVKLLNTDGELPDLIKMAEEKYDIVIEEWKYVA